MSWEKKIENVAVAVEIQAETDGALLVSDGDISTWIPKSQLVDFDDSTTIYTYDVMTLTMPEWLAKDKRLI